MITETPETPAAARFDRRFAFAAIPAGLFLLACLYVRLTSDADPLWSEFGTPLFLGLLGIRGLARPSPPETRKTNRAVGALLLVLSAIIVVLAIAQSQGAL